MKLREKKIMYLVHILQGKGYPVNQIFEEHVKPINTLRFEEFLEAKQRQAELQEMEDNAECTQFSFNASDSYELIGADVPRPTFKRPEDVPPLMLKDLPDYESTSEEEDGQMEQ